MRLLHFLPFFTQFNSYLPHILPIITSFLLPIWSTFVYEASVLSLVYSAHTLPQLLSPLCKPIHSIHPLFLSTFIQSPSSVRPIVSPWERWGWPQLSIILQVQIWCVDITWPWPVQWSLSDQYKNVQLTSPVLLNSFNAITNHISTIVTLQGQGVILHDLL